MALPPILQFLRLPVIAAPMFIASDPKLVIEQCKAGIVGSFPALNARPKETLDAWLTEIEAAAAGIRVTAIWVSEADHRRMGEASGVRSLVGVDGKPVGPPPPLRLGPIPIQLRQPRLRPRHRSSFSA